MTRDAYAREIWKIVEALNEGDEEILCPHDNCKENLKIMATSVRTGTTITCPEHGVIFRE